MNQMIDLCPYLPTEQLSIQSVGRKTKHPASSILMAIEAVVTAVIGISMLIGIAAFMLML